MFQGEGIIKYANNDYVYGHFNEGKLKDGPA